MAGQRGSAGPPQVIEVLRRAWTVGVRVDLLHGRLFYEQDVHASLYHHFRMDAESCPYVIHVDALKHQARLESRSPDIIIRSDRRIEALVEIKFAPWLRMEQFLDACRADVEKLSWIAQRADETEDLAFSLQLDTATWQTNERAARRIEHDTQYVMAVIAAAGPDEVPELVSSLRQSWHATDRLWVFAGFVRSGCRDVCFDVF